MKTLTVHWCFLIYPWHLLDVTTLPRNSTKHKNFWQKFIVVCCVAKPACVTLPVNKITAKAAAYLFDLLIELVKP